MNGIALDYAEWDYIRSGSGLFHRSGSLVSADTWGMLISWQIAEVQEPSQTTPAYLKSIFTAKLLTFYWPKQLVIL